jgi:ADP-ribose pyrophosphatase
MPERREELLRSKLFKVVRHRYTDAGGVQRTRETIQHPGAVTILPLLDDGRVCLVRNYRVAVGKELLELPAGTLEPGEAPEYTAARELAEETGYHASSIEKLTEFFMSPGILNERMHLFLATGLTLGTAAPEDGEEVAPVVLPWQEALLMVHSGQIEDAKSLAGLLYYERFRRGSAL